MTHFSALEFDISSSTLFLINLVSKYENFWYVFKHFYSEIFVETDMRAMNNPTRMNVIEEAAKILIEKIKSNCPKCKIPGFEVVEIIRGLPCENCNIPTRGAKMHLFKCKKCSFEDLKEIPNNKKYENPMYCNFCNP